MFTRHINKGDASAMYEDLFNIDKQKEFRSFFLNEASKLGVHRTYKKNEIIEPEEENFVAVVIEGKVKQSLYSPKGIEKILYILQPGELFGEINFFGGGKNHLVTKVLEASTISVLREEALNKVANEHPEIFGYFLHSIARKFRIVMFQMAGMTFNDAMGSLADTLLRLSSQQGVTIDDKTIINIPLTHQQLADLIGCSRITVTRGLNELRDKKIVDVENKKIVIKDMEKLKSYVHSVLW